MLELVPSSSGKSEKKVKCSFISHCKKIKKECVTVDGGETVVLSLHLNQYRKVVFTYSIQLQHGVLQGKKQEGRQPPKDKSHTKVF